MSKEIRSTVLTGSFWSIASNIVSNAISFAVTAGLARLLTPHDFGIIAITSVFVGIISLFQDLGMGSAIVQKQDLDDDYLSTSFSASVAAGVLLALALMAASPLVAGFYGEKVLRGLLIVSSIGFVLSPLVSIHTTLLVKRLEFGRLALINVLTQAASGAVSVVLALYGAGVWSMVLGRIIAQPLLIPVVWRMVRWRPRPVLVKKCFRDLFAFSSNLLGFNILNYFARNLDNLIIGKYLGPQPLGYYSIAYNFMLKPLQLVSWSIGRVLFPVFSRMQGESERAGQVYLKLIRTISLITFPMMTGLVMVAEEFILIVYGEEWRPVVVPLKLLCIVGAVQSIGTTGGVVFNAFGRPDLTFKLGGMAAAASVLSFLIGIRFGLNGLIIAYICVTIPNFFIGQYFVNRLIGLGMAPFLKAMAPAAACSMMMVAVLMGVKYLNVSSLHMDLAAALAMLIIAGALSYAVFIIKVFRVPEVSEALEMVRKKI